MKSYAQNREDLFVSNYFAGKTISAISIGENDGSTLSNVRGMIESGQITSAHLIEPGSVYSDLHSLYSDHPNIHTHNFGIAAEGRTAPFFESGAHIPGSDDRALVSSVNYAETERWRMAGVKFTVGSILLVGWQDFYESIGHPKIDFISLDVEGLEWEILQCMNLTHIGCSCICVEYNGDLRLKDLMQEYCLGHGLQLKLVNRENLIFVR